MYMFSYVGEVSKKKIHAVLYLKKLKGMLTFNIEFPKRQKKDTPYICDSSGINYCFIDNNQCNPNDINILAQLTVYKPLFKPDLVQAVCAGQSDLSLQFKGHVLFPQFPAFQRMRSID